MGFMISRRFVAALYEGRILRWRIERRSLRLRSGQAPTAAIAKDR